MDLSTVSDGTCEAACTIDPPVMAANTSVRVKVEVDGGSYRWIEIVEPAALAGDKGFAAMLDTVRATGHLSLDAVTAATVTSAALLKAVELAVSWRGN